MESKESIQLQQHLDKETQSIIEKLKITELVSPSPSSFNKKAEVSGKAVNVTKIIIGGVVTASLGYAIAYYTNTNEDEIENVKIYTGIGALVGAFSSYFVQKKKQTLETDTRQISIDYQQNKREVLNVIRKTNEQVRKDWETAMKELTESQRRQINNMPWTDDQKESAIDNALVYKSIIISDYHYTDAIEDLDFDEDFLKNINHLFEKWKESIVDIIDNTRNEQWDYYFSKIYTNETNQNMMS